MDEVGIGRAGRPEQQADAEEDARQRAEKKDDEVFPRREDQAVVGDGDATEEGQEKQLCVAVA